MEMSKRTWMAFIAGSTAMVVLGLVGLGFTKGTTAKKSPTEATPAAQSEAPVVLGTAGAAKWSPTTLEAASTDANKKVLAKGKPLSVTGEIVDVSCYLQLGKRGPAHVACGSKC